MLVSLVRDVLALTSLHVSLFDLFENAVREKVARNEWEC